MTPAVVVALVLLGFVLGCCVGWAGAGWVGSDGGRR